MYVGIDFGTTYTKVAYIKDKDGEIRPFKYPPGEGGFEFIPTAVAYYKRAGRETVAIGRAAQSILENEPDVQYAEVFKMLLPVRNNWTEKGWKLRRSPHEVARDYFERLLLTGENCFYRDVGEPQLIVVSVPELWQRTANNPGAEALRRILIEELKLPISHLQSEPVCAAVYYLYKLQQKTGNVRPFNLLVCDIGGGTFDVALCRVTPGRIEVVDFEGSGEWGAGSAGALFDRLVVRRALEKLRKQVPDDEFDRLVRAFEQVKISKPDDEYRLLDQVLRNPTQRDDLKDTEAYRFQREYSVTYGDVFECFTPIGQSIAKVLSGIQERARQQSRSIDRVAIVGGFGRFPLVRHAILKSLDIQEENDPRFDRRLHREMGQFHAIAHGAALVAAGRIEVVERYPHTIALRVSVRREQGLGWTNVPIVEADKVVAGHEQTCWAQAPDGRIVVQVLQRQNERLPVVIQLNGRGDWLPLDLEAVEFPEEGRYYVGVQIDRSNMGTLIFERVDGGERKEYRLGDVRFPPMLIEKES